MGAAGASFFLSSFFVHSLYLSLAPTVRPLASLQALRYRKLFRCSSSLSGPSACILFGITEPVFKNMFIPAFSISKTNFICFFPYFHTHIHAGSEQLCQSSAYFCDNCGQIKSFCSLTHVSFSITCLSPVSLSVSPSPLKPHTFSLNLFGHQASCT